MKLRNKLIPLAGIFGTCAIVTPVALTSCAKEEAQPVDLLKYTASTKKASIDGNKATVAKACEYYAKQVDADKNIFYNDMYNGIKSSIKRIDDLNSRTSTALSALVYDLNLQTVKVDEPTIFGDTKQIALASYKVELDHVCNYIVPGETHTKVDAVAHLEIEMKNVPFLLSYVPDAEHAPTGWYFSPMFGDTTRDVLAYLLDAHIINWEIDFNATFINTYTTKVGTHETSYITTDNQNKILKNMTQLEAFRQEFDQGDQYLYWSALHSYSLFMSTVAYEAE